MREQLPSHKKSLGSNISAVLTSMNITEPFKKKWDSQRRVPSLIKSRVNKEREKQANYLHKLAISVNRENHGIKNFLVVKKVAGFLCPIGFRQSFSFERADRIRLFQFAREQGRTYIKYGKLVLNVEEELAKVEKKEENINQNPITFLKNGRGKTLWNAKRNNINGYGKTKTEAENDLVNTEKNIAAIRNA